MEEQNRTGVRDKIREVQDTCRAEGWNVPISVTEVIEVTASFGAARKEKVALERSTV